MSEQKTQAKPSVEKKAPSMLLSMAMAGLAGVITVSFIHPIDVVKTRLQIAGEKGRSTQQYTGIMSAIKIVNAEGGMKAFYKGITAAYMRESVYTSIRIGLYEHAKKMVGADKKDSSIFAKFLAGAISGALGSAAGNPFDVLKTRMMASEGIVRRSVGDHSSEIYKTQGFAGFYRGIEANVMRAMVLNATKMGVYDETKQVLKTTFKFKEGLFLQFCCASVAGFFMSLTVTPFDMIRTRLMNQPKDSKIYNGMFHAFGRIIANEGPMALYKGFIPVWGRFAPTTTLQLIIFEQIRKHFGITNL